MPRLATTLILAALSLVLAPLSMAGPIPQTMSSASAVYTDLPPAESPTIAFTLGEYHSFPLCSPSRKTVTHMLTSCGGFIGPGSLPHPTASGPAASSSGLALEMDWLS